MEKPKKVFKGENIANDIKELNSINRFSGLHDEDTENENEENEDDDGYDFEQEIMREIEKCEASMQVLQKRNVWKKLVPKKTWKLNKCAKDVNNETPKKKA